MLFYKHYAIASNSEPPITQADYLLGRQPDKALPIIDHDKIVAGALIFEKVNLHRRKLIPREESRRLKNKVPAIRV